MQTWVALIGLVLVSFNTPAHTACRENVAGPTLNWAGMVCELRNETDDFENPNVQACLRKLITQDAIPKGQPEICSLNVKYKTEICRNRVALKKDISVSACVRSVKTIPNQISQGIGG